MVVLPRFIDAARYRMVPLSRPPVDDAGPLRIVIFMAMSRDRMIESQALRTTALLHPAPDRQPDHER